MSSTPEGKIKKLVKDLLGEYIPLYQYWPVPAGFGPSSLDCLVCYRGLLIGIETKAPGKKPTPRQDLCIRQIVDAGGKVFVIDGPQGVAQLKDCLDLWKPLSQPSTS